MSRFSAGFKGLARWYFWTVPFCAAGCFGAMGTVDGSVSVGTHAFGTLRRPSLLPVKGDGYRVPRPWQERESWFGTDELVGVVARTARRLKSNFPEADLVIGDLSHRTGGASAEHKSHQSGRDVDIFFLTEDTAGRLRKLGDVMLHFDARGQAFRWSPAHGERPPTSPVPPFRFAFAANWAVIRGLLLDPEVEVQWLFVERNLAAGMISWAMAHGEDFALVERAQALLHQPSDAEPHDDHMHVRLFCDAADRAFGCIDRGPLRWWTRMEKYLTPPFGRPDPAADEATQQLAAILHGTVPAAAVSPLRS